MAFFTFSITVEEDFLFCHAVSYDEPLNINAKSSEEHPDCMSSRSSRPLLRNHWSILLLSSLLKAIPGVYLPHRQPATTWTTSFVLQRNQSVQTIDTSKTPCQVFIDILLIKMRVLGLN